MENVYEELDPALEPVLLLNTYKKYNIPPSFKKVYQLKINGIKMYEIYKKK